MATPSSNPTRRKTLPSRLRRSMVPFPSSRLPSPIHVPSSTYGSYEFFYQLGLSEFGNFGTIEFAEPLNIRDLLTIAMDGDEETTPEARSEQIDVLAHPLAPTDPPPVCW